MCQPLRARKTLLVRFASVWNTIAEPTPRIDAEAATMIGKEIERAGDRVSHIASRLVKDHALSAAETRQV